MPTIFRYALTRFRGQVIGWSLGLLLLGWAIIASYDVFVKEQKKIAEVAENFKGIFEAMGADIGPDMSKIASPSTYLTMRYFSFLPLVLGILVVVWGSGLLAADEENGTLDLMLAHPVSRTAFFVGRLLAFALALLAVLAFAWIGVVVPAGASKLGEEVSWGDLALPFLSLAALLLFYGTLAVLLSMLLPSRRLGAMAASLVLVASFFLTMLARLNSDLAALAYLSPFNYYQSGEAIHGLNGLWFGGLLAAAGLFAVLAGWRFERRDIRVAGEGVWRWPWGRKVA